MGEAETDELEEHADETHEHFAGEFDAGGDHHPNGAPDSVKLFTPRQLSSAAEKQTKKAHEAEAAKSPDAAAEHASAANAHYAAAKANGHSSVMFAAETRATKKRAKEKVEHHKFQGRAHSNSQLALTPPSRGRSLGMTDADDAADAADTRADRQLDPAWQRVQRMDLASGELGERKTTPQGGMIARANLTRTGVLSYVQDDGSTRRELRHPDEVFDPKSLATLSHATLTADHPDKVTPANWRRVAIGHVASTPHRAGKFVQGEIHIQHGDAIEAADKGKLQELSCGYECAIDPTPGVFEGSPYDAVQRHIRYNHVAAGPAGWGRAGSEVRMHLDGGGAVSGAGYVRANMEPDAEKQRADFEKARADKAEADLLKLRTDAQTAEGELVGLRKLQAQQALVTTQAADQARTDASFDEQLAAIEAGNKFIGQKFARTRADGGRKTVETIRAEVVAHLQPSWKMDGLSDAEVKGMYLAAVSGAEAAQRGRQQLALTASPFFVQDKGNPFAKKSAAGGCDDDDEKDETQDAQDRMFQRQKDAWKKNSRHPARPDSGQLVPMRSAFGGGNQGNASGGFGGGN